MCPPVNLVKLLLPILIERGGLPSVVCIDSSSSSCCSSSSISIQYITISVYHYILYTSNTVYHSALWYYAVSQMAWFPYTSFCFAKGYLFADFGPLVQTLLLNSLILSLLILQIQVSATSGFDGSRSIVRF